MHHAMSKTPTTNFSPQITLIELRWNLAHTMHVNTARRALLFSANRIWTVVGWSLNRVSRVENMPCAVRYRKLETTYQKLVI